MILFYFLMNLSIPYSLKFFGFTWFVNNFVQVLINCLPGHTNVFFGFTRSQKEYKCFPFSLNHYFILVDFIFIKSSFYLKSHSPKVFPFNQFNIPIVHAPLVVSSGPKDPPPPPTLQVYSSRQTWHRPFDDTLLLPTPPSLWHRQLNLILFAIRKGICSTHNPSS